MYLVFRVELFSFTFVMILNILLIIIEQPRPDGRRWKILPSQYFSNSPSTSQLDRMISRVCGQAYYIRAIRRVIFQIEIISVARTRLRPPPKDDEKRVAPPLNSKGPFFFFSYPNHCYRRTYI